MPFASGTLLRQSMVAGKQLAIAEAVANKTPRQYAAQGHGLGMGPMGRQEDELHRKWRTEPGAHDAIVFAAAADAETAFGPRKPGQH